MSLKIIELKNYMSRYCMECEKNLPSYNKICPICQSGTEPVILFDELKQDITDLLGTWTNFELTINGLKKFNTYFDSFKQLTNYLQLASLKTLLESAHGVLTVLLNQIQQLPRSQADFGDLLVDVGTLVSSNIEKIKNTILKLAKYPIVNPFIQYFKDYTTAYQELCEYKQSHNVDEKEKPKELELLENKVIALKDRIHSEVERAKGYQRIEVDYQQFLEGISNQQDLPYSLSHIQEEYEVVLEIVRGVLSITIPNEDVLNSLRDPNKGPSFFKRLFSRPETLKTTNVNAIRKETSSKSKKICATSSKVNRNWKKIVGYLILLLVLITSSLFIGARFISQMDVFDGTSATGDSTNENIPDNAGKIINTYEDIQKFTNFKGNNTLDNSLSFNCFQINDLAKVFMIKSQDNLIDQYQFLIFLFISVFCVNLILICNKNNHHSVVQSNFLRLS